MYWPLGLRQVSDGREVEVRLELGKEPPGQINVGREVDLLEGCRTLLRLQAIIVDVHGSQHVEWKASAFFRHLCKRVECTLPDAAGDAVLSQVACEASNEIVENLARAFVDMEEIMVWE